MEQGSEKVRETSYRGNEAIIRELAGDGVAKAKDNILALRTKVQAAEDELRKLGFVLDDEGMLDLISSSSRLERTIERRLDAEVGTKDRVLTRAFDAARIKLLLVANAEEADKIVEPLLNFEMTVK